MVTKFLQVIVLSIMLVLLNMTNAVARPRQAPRPPQEPPLPTTKEGKVNDQPIAQTTPKTIVATGNGIPAYQSYYIQPSYGQPVYGQPHNVQFAPNFVPMNYGGFGNYGSSSGICVGGT